MLGVEGFVQLGLIDLAGLVGRMGQALGEVTVRVSNDGQTVKGRGVSTDVIEASAKAYVDALNRLAVWSSRKGNKPGGV